MCSLTSYWQTKTKQKKQYFRNNTQSALLASTHGGQDIKIPIMSLVPRSVSLCQNCLTSNLLKHIFFIDIPDLVNRPIAAAVAHKNCR